MNHRAVRLRLKAKNTGSATLAFLLGRKASYGCDATNVTRNITPRARSSAENERVTSKVETGAANIVTSNASFSLSYLTLYV